jgi:hypothetical protein
MGKLNPAHDDVKWINGKRVTTPEYRSWQMMKNRCLNPKAEDFKYYGGRGITVCKKWMRFEGFLEDMGRRPSPLHTLERKNNNKVYCKRNCKWATRKEQARNRGAYHTVNMILADKIRTLYATGFYRQIDIAKHFGLNQTDISQITRNVRWARDSEVTQ